MKRRLEIARGLLHYPKVLFLDEPTLGLDPQTRRSIWEHIQRLNQDEGVTIILTTHYTEEADYLSNRILIIDFGKIVALDTPSKLKTRLEGDIVSLVFKDPTSIEKIRTTLQEKAWVRNIIIVPGGNGNFQTSHMMQFMRGMSGNVGMGGSMGGIMGGVNPGGFKTGRKRVSSEKGSDGEKNGAEGAKRLHLLVDDGGHRIPEIVKLVDKAGLTLESVELHKPTLDDVFLSTTGRNIRDERGSFMEMMRRHRIVQQARGRRVRG
jgi:ABC-type multidrug transport system ATPase subunit